MGAIAYKGNIYGGATTLEELTDVNVNEPSDGQILKYDEENEKWVNDDLSKSDVGLGNVDNTSDANKPISNATAAAIAGSKTATGSVVTVTDAADIYAEQVDVAVVATQTGSGTPSPSNVRSIQGYDIVSVDRCGKNLFDGSIITGRYLNDTGAYYPNESYKCSEHPVRVNAGDKNYMSYAAYRIYYDKSMQFIGADQSGDAVVTVPANAYYMNFYQSANDTPSQIMVAKSNEAVAYEAPNHQEVSLQLGNKNLLPMTVEGIKAANGGASTWNGNSKTVYGVTFTILTDENGNVVGAKANGTASGGDATIHMVLDYESLSAGKYIVNGSIGGSASTYDVYCGFRINGSATYFNSYDGDSSVITYGASDKIYFIDIRVRNTKTVSNQIFTPMLRDANIVDPTFSPYNPSLGGMVYGGQITLKDDGSAVFVGDKAEVDLGSKTWTKYDTNPNMPYYYTTLTGGSAGKNTGGATGLDALCSCYEVVKTAYSNLGISDNGISVGSTFASSNTCTVLVRDDTKFASMTAAQFKTAVTGQQLVYELATPFTIHLSAEQLKLLQGTNNVWSNAGDVTLKYQPDNVIAEPKADVQRLRDDVDDRLVELAEQIDALDGDYLPLSGGTLTGKLTGTKIETSSDVQVGGSLFIENNYVGIGRDSTDGKSGTFTSSLDFYWAGNSYSGRTRLMNQSGGNPNITLPSSTGTLALTDSSSRKVKKNISDMTDDEASKLFNLRPVNYDYINESKGTDCYGFIAEEVKAIGITDPIIDTTFPVTDDETINVPGLDYAKFVPYLVKVVQMQQKLIDMLKSKML